jgi:aspartyl-tRNA(Asn)/glutamyl-tRNA(Gln) amidotransferase subunit A
VLEDVRIRPAADYYAVKITIAESEQYAIHEEELRTRPGDFGVDFLGRALPAVLYSGADYVQAQRERRLMLAEMAPIYEKYDLLVTPTAPGPAPRLGTWRTISFWQNSSLTTPFNVTGGPALAQCMGFTSPACRCHCSLSAGRSLRRPCCAPRMPTRRRRTGDTADGGGDFSTVRPRPVRPEPAKDDPAVRDIVLAACRRADLSLNDNQVDMICAAAPYVMAMTRRLRRERDFREEPANTFQFHE